MLGVLINLYGSWQTRHEAKSARKSTINELSRLSDNDLFDYKYTKNMINIYLHENEGIIDAILIKNNDLISFESSLKTLKTLTSLSS